MTTAERIPDHRPDAPTETEDRTEEALARIAGDASEAAERYLRETVSPGGGE